MAKKQQSLNDLSQIGSLLGMSTPPPKQEQNVMDMKEYQKLWAEKYQYDAFDIEKARYKPLYKVEIIEAIKERRFQIDNFALKLNKFPRWEQDDKGQFKFRFFGKLKMGKGQPDFKYEIKEFYGIDSRTFKSIAQRELDNAKVLTNHLEPKIFKPNWRLVVGLGSDSVYETGMTLHYIYGFPYIPASAVKGVLRNYIINECFFLSEEEKKTIKEEDFGKQKEKKALDNTDEFVKVFGSPDQQGKAIFFDAFPTEIPKLKPDIMNVHYKDWYSEGKAPTDTQQPNPILFLTVEDTPFQFLIGSKETTELKFKDKTLMTWLIAALSEHGIGAKTAVGYGYMK